MIEPYLVGVGGMIGAVLRYVVSERLESGTYPLATLIVNVLGSFALGALTFLDVPSTVGLFFGVGVCGSFTTFSSFSVGTVRLWEFKSPRKAVVFALANILGAIGAIGMAWLLFAP